MNIDPTMMVSFAIGISIVLISLLMKSLKQPYVIAYIFVGVLLGSSALGIVDNPKTFSSLGSLGVMLLLFFVGSEISLPKLLANWKVAILGTLGQMILTAGLSILLGGFFGWSLERSILISFVMVLSSTAVIIKILEESKELHTKVGQNALAIAIIHDLAIIPMMLVLTFFSKEPSSFSNTYLPIVGGLIFAGIIMYVLKKSPLHLPFSKVIRDDHELQVFVAILFCLGLAILSGVMGLSIALGAFVAGIIISNTKETHWVAGALHPFKIVFLALFFVYVGLLINIEFIMTNLWSILLWVAFIFIINTVISTIILMLLKNSFRESVHVAAILAQSGEFGFLLVAIGLANNIIGTFDYDFAISVISSTLLLSPLWIVIIKKIVSVDKAYIYVLRKNYAAQMRLLRPKR